MAWEDNIQTITLEAGGNLTQYTFASVAADGQLDATGDGAHADGVVQNDPAAEGDATTLAIGGVCKVNCGGNVTRGGAVASDSSGKAVNAASGDVIVGTALETGTSGDTIAMLFQPRGTA